MTPTEKADGIDHFIASTTGIDRVKTITQNKCALCNHPNLEFRDLLSKREYEISGICMTCQDMVFTTD